MPIREYVPNDDCCPHCLGGFELIQQLSDPPLTECPECGRPCHQVFSGFSVGGSLKSTLSKSNLEAHGFTQYTKKGKGYYEKTAGKGPSAIADGS